MTNASLNCLFLFFLLLSSSCSADGALTYQCPTMNEFNNGSYTPPRKPDLNSLEVLSTKHKKHSKLKALLTSSCSEKKEKEKGVWKLLSRVKKAAKKEVKKQLKKKIEGEIDKATNQSLELIRHEDAGNKTVNQLKNLLAKEGAKEARKELDKQVENTVDNTVNNPCSLLHSKEEHPQKKLKLRYVALKKRHEKPGYTFRCIYSSPEGLTGFGWALSNLEEADIPENFVSKKKHPDVKICAAYVHKKNKKGKKVKKRNEQKTSDECIVTS